MMGESEEDKVVGETGIGERTRGKNKGREQGERTRGKNKGKEQGE
jgi:hypothetical protein